MTIYLDCNATTPLEQEVVDTMKTYLEHEYANAGSRTHELGNRAKAAVENARTLVGGVVDADKSDVIFTSGATESNNLAILGLEKFACDKQRKHIITTEIEHKSVLEPIALLENKGFDVTYLRPNKDGIIPPSSLSRALKDETVLVSTMHVNNETGCIQPITEYAQILQDHDAFFHVDAAQSFGKEIEALKSNRIDLISCSAHKVFGPKGIGALITRRRKYKHPPLSPLMLGGGQEKGLRPGTLPVHQIAGFGTAAMLALGQHEKRRQRCNEIKEAALAAFSELDPSYHGIDSSIASTLNVSFKGINSEAAIVALKGVAAISNGSACTSSNYSPSHVLQAMGLDDEEVLGALRFSWCHLTEDINWDDIASVIKSLG